MTTVNQETQPTTIHEGISVLSNRIAAAFAKQETLIKSWTDHFHPQISREADQQFKTTHNSIQAEPVHLGVGAEIPLAFLASQEGLSKNSLRAKFFSTKGLKASKARDAEEKAASAKRGLREESSDEEEGRSALGKAKKVKRASRALTKDKEEISTEDGVPPPPLQERKASDSRNREDNFGFSKNSPIQKDKESSPATSESISPKAEREREKKKLRRQRKRMEINARSRTDNSLIPQPTDNIAAVPLEDSPKHEGQPLKRKRVEHDKKSSMGDGSGEHSGKKLALQPLESLVVQPLNEGEASPPASNPNHGENAGQKTTDGRSRVVETNPLVLKILTPEEKRLRKREEKRLRKVQKAVRVAGLETQ